MLTRSPFRQTLWTAILLILVAWGLISCGDRLETSQLGGLEKPSQPLAVGRLSEVAPPPIIQQLRQSLAQYQPQVTIVSPQPEQVFQETTIKVQLQVQDLPLFKDTQLGLGPNLHLILDNEPYLPIYNLEEPIVLENLTPGTHTLRVFAARPWQESFKNEGAYAQTSFHIFTKTSSNRPDAGQPLLTYSLPQGNYGAEPILLDFYLTNAPLHAVAQESSQDEIADWRIRVTINGESFLLDNWQPIYLKGFVKGNNWVQLEFLDEQGNPVDNAFNNTVRLITYEAKGQDSLSQLVRGELPLEEARAIVDANYRAKPTPLASPSPEARPTPLPTPIEQETPEVEKVETEETPPPTPEETSQPLATPSPTPEETPLVEAQPSPAEVIPTEVTPTPSVEP